MACNCKIRYMRKFRFVYVSKTRLQFYSANGKIFRKIPNFKILLILSLEKFAQFFCISRSDSGI